MAKILLVEDDSNLAVVIEDGISGENHIVDVAHDGRDGFEMLCVSKYDLIILDWELPSLTGIEILEQLRSRGIHSPVLMLTGKGSINDKSCGFDHGADDYLTKPFHMKELLARVRALLRRPTSLMATNITAGNVTLDPANHKVFRDGTEVELPRLEFAVLEFLMRHPGQVFSNDALLERIWPVDSERTPQSVRTLIKKLRAKIDGDGPSIIHNIYGVGYKVEAP